MTQDPGSQTSIITLYDRSTSRGKVVKFSNKGRRLYEKNTSAAYTELRINGNGDLLMASPAMGQVEYAFVFRRLLF